jgi:hypothetical protein
MFGHTYFMQIVIYKYVSWNIHAPTSTFNCGSTGNTFLALHNYKFGQILLVNHLLQWTYSTIGADFFFKKNLFTGKVGIGGFLCSEVFYARRMFLFLMIFLFIFKIESKLGVVVLVQNCIALPDVTGESMTSTFNFKSHFNRTRYKQQ